MEETYPQIPCAKRCARLNQSLVIYDSPSGDSFEKIIDKEIKGKGNGGIVLQFKGSVSYRISNKETRSDTASLLVIKQWTNITELNFSKDFEGFLFGISECFVDSLLIDYTSSPLWLESEDIVSRDMDQAEIHIFRNYAELLCSIIRNDNYKSCTEVAILLAKAMSYKIMGMFMNVVDKEATSRQEIIAAEFIKLVRKYGSEKRDLEFYADNLCISMKYMSHTVSKITGKKCCDWIADYTISQAKLMLRSSSMSIGQISEIMKFRNQGEFARYFKSKVGVTPTQYRNN